MDIKNMSDKDLTLLEKVFQEKEKEIQEELQSRRTKKREKLWVNLVEALNAFLEEDTIIYIDCSEEVTELKKGVDLERVGTIDMSGF